MGGAERPQCGMQRGGSRVNKALQGRRSRRHGSTIVIRVEGLFKEMIRWIVSNLERKIGSRRDPNEID